MEIAPFQKRLESLKTLPKSKITNKRQYWIGQFLDTLNLARKGAYKPLSAPRLGYMLRFVKTDDLEGFFDECRYSGNFSRFFWSRFKK